MSKKGGSKSTKVKKTSSGMRRVRRARKELRLIESKVRRWTAYQSDEKRMNSPAGRRRDGWSTIGLLKRAKQLEAVIALGRKVAI